MKLTPSLRHVVAAALASAVGVTSACQQILDPPDRQLHEHVAACNGGTCTCKPGFDFCGTTDCGVDLTKSQNCGRCGHDCLDPACNSGVCGEHLLPYDPEPLHQGAVVTDGYVFVLDNTNDKVLGAPTTGDALTEMGSFEGLSLGFIGNNAGGFFLTIPPSELESGGPYHANMYSVSSTGVKLETTFTWSNSYPYSFAATSKAFYLAVRNRDNSGFPELHRYDRAAQKETLLTDTIDGFVDARNDTVFWAASAVLTARPEGATENQVIYEPASAAFVDWYAYDDHYVYSYTAPDLTRIDRTTLVATTISDASTSAVDLDGGAAIWCNTNSNTVFAWADGDPTMVADGFNFAERDFEYFTAAHDPQMRFWADRAGVHRLVE